VLACLLYRDHFLSCVLLMMVQRIFVMYINIYIARHSMVFSNLVFEPGSVDA